MKLYIKKTRKEADQSEVFIIWELW